MFRYLLLLALLFAMPVQGAGHPPSTKPVVATHRDFRQAKKVLPQVYANLEETFYCGCRYKGNRIDLASCGYAVRKNAQRAARLEWEHVVPAWVIGHQRQCWQSGGRKNCTAHDPVFGKAEGDLVNLVPSIGEVNADRSNLSYGEWDADPAPMYGQCRTVVDFKNRRVQPRAEVRGRIARIQMYMYATYGLRMSTQDRRLSCAWARIYPVDGWERERQSRLQKFQGTRNPFVDDAAAVQRFCAS